MIKKLRRRFIFLSMAAMLVLLSAIVTGMNLINFYSVVSMSDETLTFLAGNDGVFPEDGGKGKRNLPPHISPEAPYENRYFSVFLDADDQVLRADTRRIRAVDQSQAAEYAVQAAGSGKHRGFIDVYRFITFQNGSETQIIFLDCSRSLHSFRTFLLASIGMALAGYLIFSFVIFFFSKGIVKPAAESYEKQKRFITDAGHEIKTPLTIIRADTDVLEMDLGENEWLTDIQKQAKRLADLTNDLICLSRMEEGDSMPMIEFPFSDVVNETAASFAALACTQKKTFRREIQPQLSLTGNEKAIRQLVGLLLDNALKYSPEGGLVTLTLKKQNRSLLLSVTNTTITPVPQETLPLLFERFYRADSSRNSQTGGHGIGLSVAKAIVTAHGGRIQAENSGENSLQITAVFPSPAPYPPAKARKNP